MTKSPEESFDKEVVLERLRHAWSSESSSLYSEKNPARGHCGVTALVIQDHFGGEIRKTPTEDGDHFYNYIGQERYDLTIGQFDDPPSYLDLPSDRDEAFNDTNQEQYASLSERFRSTVTDD